MLVAVIAAVVSGRQAKIARDAARDSARSAIRQAAQDRFGPWQLKKREVYASFLAAGQPLRVAGAAKEADRREFAVAATTLLLYAYEDARVSVRLVLGQPDLLTQPDTWNELVEILRKDVLIPGSPT